MGGAASAQQNERRRRMPAALASTIFRFPSPQRSRRRPRPRVASQESAEGLESERLETVGALPGAASSLPATHVRRASGRGLPPRAPGTLERLSNSTGERVVATPTTGGHLVIRTPMSLNKLDSGLDYTPYGSEADQYRFYCPLCMNYYKDTYESSCCQNYICKVCLHAFLKRKGVNASILPSGDLSFNLSTKEELSIACPHCGGQGFQPRPVSASVQTVRSYLDSTLKDKNKFNLPSPVKVGDSFEELKRKLLLYEEHQNQNTTSQKDQSETQPERQGDPLLASGLTNASAFGMSNSASRQDLENVSNQAEGFSEGYPSLCPPSPELQSPEAHIVQLHPRSSREIQGTSSLRLEPEHMEQQGEVAGMEGRGQTPNAQIVDEEGGADFILTPVEDPCEEHRTSGDDDLNYSYMFSEVGEPTIQDAEQMFEGSLEYSVDSVRMPERSTQRVSRQESIQEDKTESLEVPIIPDTPSSEPKSLLNRSDSRASFIEKDQLKDAPTQEIELQDDDPELAPNSQHHEPLQLNTDS